MIKSFDGNSSSISSRSDEHARCCGCTFNTRTAPLVISICGMSTCAAFMTFYVLHREWILLFPLITMFGCHLSMLLGNRLRKAVLYAPLVYSTKFLITMLVTGMLFYIYVIVGDAKRRPPATADSGTSNRSGVWAAFQAEIVRVSVAVGLILFAVVHYTVLRVVKADDASLQYERFQQRTATIYSLASECQSRTGEEVWPGLGGPKAPKPLAPYLSTVISASSFTNSASLASSRAHLQPLIREMV